MKVLLVYMDGFQVCFEHIVTYLRSKDIEVNIEVIEAPPGEPNQRNRFIEPEFVDKHRKENYDYIIWCEHSTSGEFEFFERQLGVKSICIEHDLLTLHPQTSINNVLTFAFTKPHYKWCVDNNINVRKAKFYKEAIQPTIEKEEGLNAAIIGSEYWAFAQLMDKENEFKYADFFDKVYYKPFGEGETPVKGTIVHPETLGAHGTRNLAQLARYWFVVNSSSYIDALLFGCVPIVLGGKDNPYFQNGLFYGEMPCNYINHPSQAEEIDLKESWLFEDEDLPTVEEVLYEQLRHS